MSGGFSDVAIELFGLPFLVPAYAQQVALSIFFGLVIGLERESRGKPASLRTFTIISVGSCVFTILSVRSAAGYTSAPFDYTRIAAQIVSGVGFLGAGVIFKTSDRIEGITTAALIWLASGLGMSCGFNAINLALWVFGLCLATHIFVVVLYRIIFWVRSRQGDIEYENPLAH